ncbi:PREDICTED: uncharacterized protein LOC104600503 [Nelumbo nucifera]|uniref:Uncharacterized protein LOC104600503 n=1 Tax=Nelumbo nucifera TaxID=4432 RepID=A0A1U8A5P5_NELNU|nr:PREDICTED: uncharacterized protein LOC104600503 [Nelumbo nucifera]
MLGRRSRPMIGKLPDPLVSGHERIIPSEVITSPKSPLDLKIRSPRGLKNCDLGAVGLGIVAALDKSSRSGCESEFPAKFVVGSLNLNRSDPIPVDSTKSSAAKSRGGLDRPADMDDWESYTSVTRHGHNKASFARLYCDGAVENGTSLGYSRDRRGFDRRCNNKNNHHNHTMGVFCESPPRWGEEIPAFPTSDFLSACYLCRKKLHGRDIYMYRGEKAFCSAECRYRQIVIDECKEKFGSGISRSADLSCSPYSSANGQLFSTGIIAA